MVGRLGMLTVDTSNLHLETVGNRLKFVFSRTKFGQSNVNGRSESCSEVSWARSDVAKMVIMSETSNCLNMGGSF